MIDTRALIWLRWKQLQGSLRFWLAALTYDTRDKSFLNRVYAAYLFTILAGWLALMWSYAAGAVVEIASQLPFSLRETVESGLPPLVAVAQIAAIALALRSSPFRLSLPDMAYVAGSPMPRVVVTLVAFAVAALQLAAVVAFLVPLTAGALAEPLEASAAAAAAQATLAALLLAVLSSALAWLAGLAPVALPSARWLRAGWLVAALLVVPAYLIPGVALFPGRVLAAALVGEARALDFLALVGATVAALAALVWLARRASLVAVADESVASARIAALGLAAWSAPDLTQRIRTQHALLSRPPRARLAEAEGTRALVARAWLSGRRHPTTLLWAVLAGVGYAEAGSRILLSQTALLTLGVAWVVGMALRPPRGLVGAYRADLARPFVLQLLRVDRLTLLLADAAVPLGLVGVAVIGLGLVQPAPLAAGGIGTAFALLIAYLLALCQGIGLLEPAIAGVVRLTYARVALVAYGALLLVSASGSAAALLGTAVLLALALSLIAARAGMDLSGSARARA